MCEQQFIRLFTDHYQRSILSIEELQSYQESYRMFRIHLESDICWIFQLYHESYRDRPIFPWASTHPISWWLYKRASLLCHLEQHNYPAPHVISTADGALIAHHHGWHALVTTFVKGKVDDQSIPTLSLLGAALGRLHQLPLAKGSAFSWWNPSTLDFALHQIETISTFVPPSYKDLHQQVQATCREIASSNLPITLIHGDAWGPNAILSQQQEVTLIDWEFSGKGAALLDLGALLLMGQCDKKGDLAETIDPKRVLAVVTGYRQHRPLTQLELDWLLQATQFAIAWRGAIVLSRLLTEEWTPGIERFLGRVERGFIAAEAVARVARAAFLEMQKD